MGTYYYWSWILCVMFVVVVSVTNNVLPSAWERGVNNFGSELSGRKVQPITVIDNEKRVKRSPFIMAFQVTKPPGMFQMGMRRPYIFNMMSNLTRSLFSASFTDLLRRGFGQLGFPSSNSTVVETEAVRSRQEDLELFEK